MKLVDAVVKPSGSDGILVRTDSAVAILPGSDSKEVERLHALISSLGGAALVEAVRSQTPTPGIPMVICVDADSGLHVFMTNGGMCEWTTEFGTVSLSADGGSLVDQPIDPRATRIMIGVGASSKAQGRLPGDSLVSLVEGTTRASAADVSLPTSGGARELITQVHQAVPSVASDGLERDDSVERISFDLPVDQDHSPLPIDEPTPKTDQVLGVPCPVDHHNHPLASFCRLCGRRMAINRTLVPRLGDRPPLGLLVGSDGSNIPIARHMVVGRDPSGHPEVSAERAVATPVVDPALRVSRAHIHIQLDEWSVTVRDLETTNGTLLVQADGHSGPLSSESYTKLKSGDVLAIGSLEFRLELHSVSRRPI